MTAISLSNGFTFERTTAGGQVTIVATFPATSESFTTVFTHDEWLEILSLTSQYEDLDHLVEAGEIHGTSIGTPAQLTNGPYELDYSSDLSTASLDDDIEYTFSITNTSDVRTLSLIEFVNDTWLISDFTWDPEFPTELGPGESFTGSYIHTVDAADVSAGHINTNGGYTGVDTYGNSVSDSVIVNVTIT